MIELKLNFRTSVSKMQDDRLIKSIMFGIMEGANRRGRPKREWLNDTHVTNGAIMDMNSIYCTLKRFEAQNGKLKPITNWQQGALRHFRAVLS